ncbi:MAG: LamG-like jellyroll fold domain-containing protein [Thalassotalea sp.]
MNRSDEFQEIKAIADSVCNEDVSPAQVEQLEVLLKDNEAAQRFYYEYIDMHVHMSAASESAVEIVRRKLQIEEVIIRPANRDGNVPIAEQPFDISHLAFDKPNSPTPPLGENSPKRFVYFGILALCLFVAILLFVTINRSTSNFLTDIFSSNNYLAQVIEGRLNTRSENQNDSSYLMAGTYTAEKPTVIKLITGDELALEKFSRLKLFNNTEVELKQGTVAISKALGKNIEIYAPNFTVNSEGSTVTVDIYNNFAEVSTGQETSIIPNRWRPTHYWPFDSNSDRVIDLAGDAYGLTGSGAKRVNGLVGTGAFEFDNSASARLNVGSGGGTAPATGSFSVTDGVTIEALIKPQFNGLPREQDQIFRKDQSDKELRMLLSFQNDKGKTYLKPEGDVDESLSFGLYLVGQGYHELKLPLDGKGDRPSLRQLKDGNAHHVVASYDVSSGLKAIYIDGKMLASYQYPPGSKILSGGSGMANIGNSPNHDKDYEAFAGVIDEVAFYDFALPNFMIEQHYAFSQQGLNYFGFKANTVELPEIVKIQLPAYKTVVIDPLTGLPKSIKTIVK